MSRQERSLTSDTESILNILCDILSSSLLIQMVMHGEMAQKKAGFKKGLYTSR